MTFNIEASEQCVDVASREIGNGNLEKAEKLLNKVRKKKKLSKRKISSLKNLQNF